MSATKTRRRSPVKGFARAAAAAPHAVPVAWRRRLLVAAAALAVLALGWYGWLRDAPFAQVDEVRVTGIDGPQAGAVRAALTDAARNMTTLHVREDELREAVDAYPTITSLEAKPDFPHRLVIEVRDDPPVGAVAFGSERVPVARDGSLLKGVRYDHHLPLIAANARPGIDRIAGGPAHRLLTVLAGAPDLMLRRVRDVRWRKADGIVVRLRRGPALIFGDSERVRAKWLAATRVLASRSARGATYVDLRLPDRPAAGGLGEESVSPTTTPGVQTEPPAGGTATVPVPQQNPQPEVETLPQP